jgi:hypothetical protein
MWLSSPIIIAKGSVVVTDGLAENIYRLDKYAPLVFLNLRPTRQLRGLNLLYEQVYWMEL